MSDVKRYTTIDELMEDMFKLGTWYEESYWAVWRFVDNFKPKNVAYTIERWIRWVKWGFNPKDIWSLDYSLSEWIVPRLKMLRETKQGCPFIDGFDEIYSNPDATEDEWEQIYKAWDEIMGKMILAFELVIKDDHGEERLKNEEKIEEGLKLFARYFRNLWD